MIVPVSIGGRFSSHTTPTVSRGRGYLERSRVERLEVHDGAYHAFDAASELIYLYFPLGENQRDRKRAFRRSCA